MKKIIVIVLGLAYCFTSNAQDTLTIIKLAKKKINIIDVYYGYPFIDDIFQPKPQSKTIAEAGHTIKYKNTNHFGCKYDYLIDNSISLGLEYTFAQREVNAESYNYPKVSDTLISNFKLSRHRLLLKFTAYLNKNKNFNPYLCFGGGLRMTYYNQNLNSNNKCYFDKISFANNFETNSFPIAIRFGLGFRWFVSKHIAINTEIGIGGPLVQAGLSYKFTHHKTQKQQ